MECTNPLFLEKQRFTQWWLAVLLLGVNGFFLFGLIAQVFMGVTISDKPIANEVFIAGAIVFPAFTLLFYSQFLATRIDDNGIHIKFRNFRTKEKFYSWQEIKDCEMKVYSPVLDYGGWRMSDGVYNTAGNKGMLLRFKDKKKKHMIGTQKPEELKAVLEKVGKLKTV